MVFHKVAIDVISKGLDPHHPHKDLGADGMLVDPNKKVLTAVSSVSGSQQDIPSKKETSVKQLEQTTAVVVAKTVRKPPVRTSKNPSGSSS